MQFNRIVSKEFVAVMGCGAAAGFLIGVALASAVYVDRINEFSSTLGQQSARVALLEGLVASPPDFAALDVPNPSAAPAAPPMPGAKAAGQARPPAAPTAARAAVMQVAPTRRVPAVAVVAPQSSQGPQVPTSPRPVHSDAASADSSPAVTPEEISAAVANAKVEGVPAEKARVAKISSEGVLLSNGKLIRPGERFGSGEKLLQVDPSNNRVITSERQLLLFFGN